MLRSRSALLAIFPLLFGCNEARVLNIEVVTGHETSAMTDDPTVAKVVVTGEADSVYIQAEAAPGEPFDFGVIDGSLAYTFEATGFDSGGATVMRGRTIGGIVLDSISGDTFQIFAQRLRAWARPPGTLSRAHTRAPAVSVGERYLFTTGGDGEQDAEKSEVYDLFAWAGASGGNLPFAAHTLWSDVDAILALGSETGGEAAWLEDSGISDVPLTLPEGLNGFGEVAGGSVVLGTDSRVYLVGPTRAGTPTDAVIEIASDGSAAVRRLLQPRAGAAATWLQDVGLVIAGGSAEGPGVEVLAEEATAFTARDFPSDPTSGAGAAPSHAQGTVYLVGGLAEGIASKTRVLDLGCQSGCAATEIDLATPDAALTRVTTYYISDKRLAIVVGDEPDPSGLTRTFLIEELTSLMPAVIELPLREPRRWATPVPAPNGTLALIGGVRPDGEQVLTVEMLLPE